jgi:hypothetical protein
VVRSFDPSNHKRANASKEVALMLLVTGPKYQLPFETFALETIKTNRIHHDHHDFQWTESQ